jgi:hypothetical protein
MLFNFGISIQRFPEYEELSDGTLSRIEGSKEFQVYPDDIKRCPFHEVTQELLAEHRGSPCRKARRNLALWRSLCSLLEVFYQGRGCARDGSLSWASHLHVGIDRDVKQTCRVPPVSTEAVSLALLRRLLPPEFGESRSKSAVSVPCERS